MFDKALRHLIDMYSLRLGDIYDKQDNNFRTAISRNEFIDGFEESRKQDGFIFINGVSVVKVTTEMNDEADREWKDLVGYLN